MTDPKGDRINLAELRAFADDGWSLDPPAALALIDAVEAARACRRSPGFDNLERLDSALARFDFGDDA
jgi:hypothetical protein